MQRGDGKCDQRPMIFIASVKMVFDMVINFILFYLTSNYRWFFVIDTDVSWLNMAENRWMQRNQGQIRSKKWMSQLLIILNKNYGIDDNFNHVLLGQIK